MLKMNYEELRQKARKAAQYSSGQPNTAKYDQEEPPVQANTALYSWIHSSKVHYSPLQPNTAQYSPVQARRVQYRSLKPSTAQ